MNAANDPQDRSTLIIDIKLDEASIDRNTPEVEHERQVAIFDILEDNKFFLDDGTAGPYRLKLAIVEKRLVVDIFSEERSPLTTFVLSLSPLSKLIKDYFLVCESYYEAIKTAPPSRIEALDMGRRGLHDEGSRFADRAAERQDHHRFRNGKAAVHPDLRVALERIASLDATPPAAELPKAVLFACNMNAVRSPMAEAILRHLAGRQIYVELAGVRAGEADPFAVAVMEEIGIDLSRHAPQAIADLYDTSFDLVVSLSPEAHHQALEMTRTQAIDAEYWPTMDPTAAMGSREQILNAYREVRDTLFRRIKGRFPMPGAPAHL